MYDNVFFDLDGTLTDSGPGITNCVMYALERFGIRVERREELYCFIGPPLMDSFQRFYGFSEQDARRAVQYYRERYHVTGLFENEVYPGVPEMLEQLRAAGKRLWVATSKPEALARRVLDHFSLTAAFEGICGASADDTRTSKGEVIRYALECCGNPPPETVLMAGDRKHDVLGAAECGLDCLGVLYGYGDRAELDGAGAKYLADSPAEAALLILSAGN
ncbi:MAG: HAD family hydrolase [Oscillospiraceae bacterium]|nr:HAD family hydrolase [Oscillospiraceae bacterium]